MYNIIKDIFQLQFYIIKYNNLAKFNKIFIIVINT